MKSPKVFAFFCLLLATLAGQGNAQVTTRAAAAAATHASTAAAATAPTLAKTLQEAGQYITWDAVKGAVVWVGGSVSATQAAGVTAAVGVGLIGYHYREEIISTGFDAYHRLAKDIAQLRATHTGGHGSGSTSSSSTGSDKHQHHQHQQHHQAPPPPPAGLDLPLPNHEKDGNKTHTGHTQTTPTTVQAKQATPQATMMTLEEHEKKVKDIVKEERAEAAAEAIKAYKEAEKQKKVQAKAESATQTEPQWLKEHKEVEKQEKAQMEGGNVEDTKGQGDASFQATDGAQTKTYGFPSSYIIGGVSFIVILCAIYHYLGPYLKARKRENDRQKREKIASELIKEEAASASSTPTTSPSKRQRGSSADLRKASPPPSPSTAAAPAPGATHTHTGTHTGKNKGKGGYLSIVTGNLGSFLGMGNGHDEGSLLKNSKKEGDDKGVDGAYEWNPRMGKTGAPHKGSPGKKKGKGHGKKK